MYDQQQQQSAKISTNQPCWRLTRLPVALLLASCLLASLLSSHADAPAGAALALPTNHVRGIDSPPARLVGAAILPNHRTLRQNPAMAAAVAPDNQTMQKVQQHQQLDPMLEQDSGKQPAKNKKDKKKKKKKKKKNQRFGPPGTRDVRFKGPLINPASFPGLELQPIQGPWRHSITYEIDWRFNPSLLESFMYAHLADNDRPQQRVPPQGPYVMDVRLYPLEPGKIIELLLASVPLTTTTTTTTLEASQQLHQGTLRIPLQPDIPVGWYRLDIQVWDMGYRHRPVDSEITPREVEDLDWIKSKEAAAAANDAAVNAVDAGAKDGLSAGIQVGNEGPVSYNRLGRTFWSIASWIVSGPGKARLQEGAAEGSKDGTDDGENKSRQQGQTTGDAQRGRSKSKEVFVENKFYNKRRVAVWRSTEAIEVTTLSHQDPEWNEFMRNSREDLQDKLEHMYADDPVQLAEKLELVRLDTIEYREAAKAYRMPRPRLRVVQADGALIELEQEKEGNKDDNPNKSGDALTGSSTWPSSSPADRSVYDQGTFRFRKEMGIVFSRVPPPPPVLDEDDLAEIEAAKPEAEKIKEVRDWQHLESWLAAWFDTAAERVHDNKDRKDEETSFKVAENQYGAGELHVQIEYMNRVLSEDRLFTVPVNADRVVSWEVSDDLMKEQVAFDVELIQVPLEKIVSITSSRQPVEMVRSNLVQAALQMPRTALIADRIRGSWGAFSIRIPSYVTQGPYQIRLNGVSKDGHRWTDVSQPFMVLSDPFIYSYPPY